MNVLVFADNDNGKAPKAAFEAASYGSNIAAQHGGTAHIFTYGTFEGNALSELGQYGISAIIHAQAIPTMDPMQLARVIATAADEVKADLIVFSHDYTGKSIAPIVSAKLKAGLVTGAVALPQTDNGFTVKTNVFSGKAFAEVSIQTPRKVISLLPNSFSKQRVEKGAEIKPFSGDAGSSSVRVLENKVKSGDGINLTEAELVVSAGRGLKGPEHWGMIEDLAKALGAATACSRPVADIGWRPHHEHVGQTGIAIRPNLYIAVGISGAIQHLAGVNGSKVIVVINTDPEAPFFKAADYGIVGDAFDVVPKLVEAVKAFKASHA
jgi:electron transfer flavoprotein alpha subunit